MSNYYICNTTKNAIGRSAFKLKAKRCPNFQVDDIVYMSDQNQLIHSRLVVTSVGKNIITLIKQPEISISITQAEALSRPYADKFSILTSQDSETLEKQFIHQMKVLPYYDYHSTNQETNALLSDLKKLDLKIELYPDAISSNDLVNLRLDEPSSILIINSYGVITFKCIEEDPITGSSDLKTKFANQIKSNDIKKTLAKSPQLTDEDGTLTINHLDIIIFETDNTEAITRLNTNLEESGSSTRVFNRQSFIDFLKRVYNDRNILDEVKRVGIVQSLLPQYINSKTIDITSEPLDFTPDDTFELDDIQKDTLRHLNQRTYIKASAGSGKTILLLAKAYEVAKANPEKQFLLLCYNNKLAADIQNQATNTGRDIKNLKICTFDKFLIEQNIIFKLDGDTTNNQSATYIARKKAFVEQIQNGKLHLSYGGIFVDEVQQMRPEWLTALINCTDEQKYMIVSGDYYQSINLSLIDDEDSDDDFIEEGDTTDFQFGGYTFETIVLDKNYRNTKPVAKVLSNMITIMNLAAGDLDIPKKEERVLGHAYKESIIMPRYIKTNQKQEAYILEQIIDSLINEHECAPSDILITHPKPSKLIREIDNNLSLKYPVCNFGSRSSFGNRSGIRIGTIAKSIGLDFKAVILCNTNLLKDFRKNSDDNIEDIEILKHQSKNSRRKYLSILKHIYVACSRAREILIVLDDAEPENLFTKFLIESGLEKG